MQEAARQISFPDKGWLSLLLDTALLAPIGEPSRDERQFARMLLETGATLGVMPESGITAADGVGRALVTCLLATFRELRALERAADGARTDRMARAAMALAVADLAGHDRASGLLTAVVAAPPDDGSESRARRAERMLESWLEGWSHGLGQPPGGLPLHSTMLVIAARSLRRTFQARLVTSLDTPRRLGLLRWHDAAARTSTVELAASLFAADQQDPAIVERQVRSIGLRPPHRQRALAAMTQPRDLDVLGPLWPHATLETALQAIALDAKVQDRWNEPVATRLKETFARIDLSASQEAAAHHAAASPDQVAALGRPQPERWQDSLEGATDRLAELGEALANEVRETGELGALLARSAAGEILTAEEKGRMREQLIDLAKAVPSLAVLAAPGGSLILPLLLKYLPFDLRPSSFQPKTRQRSRPQS